MRGWVYIITTKSIQSLKIGFSTKDPVLRASELSNTGNPHPYILRYDALVKNPRDIEQKVHKSLSRFHDGKEWFNCSLYEAITSIRKVANNILIEETYGFNNEQDLCKESDVDLGWKRYSHLVKAKKPTKIEEERLKVWQVFRSEQELKVFSDRSKEDLAIDMMNPSESFHLAYKQELKIPPKK